MAGNDVGSPGGSGGSLEPRRGPIYTRWADLRQRQGVLIAFALASSNLFGLFLAGLYEFLSLRGVVNVPASRIVLLIVLIVGCVLAGLVVWSLNVHAKKRTVGSCAIMLAFLLYGLDSWAPKPSAISLRPNQRFLLRKGNFASRTPLFVTNTRDTPIYSAYIKISTTDPGITAHDIRINPDLKLGSPPMRVGDVVMQTDVIVWDFVDSQNHQAALIRFFMLKPRDTRTLVVCSASKNDGWATPEVLGGSDSPSPLGTYNEDPGFSFISPDKGTMTGLRLFTNTGDASECQ